MIITVHEKKIFLPIFLRDPQESVVISNIGWWVHRRCWDIRTGSMYVTNGHPDRGLSFADCMWYQLAKLDIALRVIMVTNHLTMRESTW